MSLVPTLVPTFGAPMVRRIDQPVVVTWGPAYAAVMVSVAASVAEAEAPKSTQADPSGPARKGGAGASLGLVLSLFRGRLSPFFRERLGNAAQADLQPGLRDQ